jgi:acyl carrier protein
MSVTTDVREFIVAELAVGRDVGTLEPDDDLLAKGIVDSHGVMELVGFLEERYGISVADVDLTPENFQTLAQIEGFVARKGG